MSRFLIALLALFMPCLVQAAPYRLAVFGDSLSAGYHLPKEDAFYSQLEKALSDKGYDIQVLHASKSGETTSGGLSRQESVLSQHPDGVLLELGINDVFKKKDLNQTKKNLEMLITRFQEQNIPVLLIGMKAPPNYPNRQDFEKIYHNLAKKYDLSFYPFFMNGIFKDKFLIGYTNPYLLSDNLHPNAEGLTLMVRKILPTVEEFLNSQGIYAD